MASTASVMRCSAVSAPIVMSVPNMSLSIEPTRPTSAQAAMGIGPGRVERTPSSTSSSSSSGHSWRNMSAPGEAAVATDDHEPVDVRARRGCGAARRRPSRVRKSSLRAVPSTVPPRCRMPPTSAEDSDRMRVAAVDQALQALVDARRPRGPAASPVRTTARTAGVHAGGVAAAGEHGELGRLGAGVGFGRAAQRPGTLPGGPVPPARPTAGAAPPRRRWTLPP